MDQKVIDIIESSLRGRPLIVIITMLLWHLVSVVTVVSIVKLGLIPAILISENAAVLASVATYFVWRVK